MNMVGTKIILSILGVGVTCAGGYFIIDKITQTKWITLAKSNEEAYRGRENGSKFGTKFRDWMVSTTREKNKGFWEGRIRVIADLNENNSLKTDGYLAGVAEKATA